MDERGLPDNRYGTALIREMARHLPHDQLLSVFSYEHFVHECRPELIASALLEGKNDLPELNGMEHEACELLICLHSSGFLEEVDRHELRRLTLATCMCLRAYVFGDDTWRLMMKLPLLFLAITAQSRSVTRLGLDFYTWLTGTAKSSASLHVCRCAESICHAWLAHQLGIAALSLRRDVEERIGETLEEFWQDETDCSTYLPLWQTAWSKAFEETPNAVQVATSVGALFGSRGKGEPDAKCH